MNNIDEQLSALMDGEESDINLILDNMQDQQARNHWKCYHLIRDVMRNQVSRVDTHDISHNIHDAILNEPTILAPLHKNSFSQKLAASKTFVKQIGSMAIAATVTAVAILVVQQNPDLDNQQSMEMANQSITGNNIQTSSTRNIELNKAVAAKLNSYLVNHNEYSVSSGMQGALPYSRVVNFKPTISIVRSINAK